MDTIADFYRGCFIFVLGLGGGFILGNAGKIFDWWLDWVFGKQEDEVNDRLAEIKKWLKGNYVLKAGWSERNNIKWLILELEKCRAEITKQKTEVLAADEDLYLSEEGLKKCMEAKDG